jgi:hypothetical protein
MSRATSFLPAEQVDRVFPSMNMTILYGDGPRVEADAREDGERLWVSPTDLEAVTGWKLKREGLCRDEACVPLPSDGSWLDDLGHVDLAAFARRFHRPIVNDSEHAVWAFGESANTRAEQLLSLRAPEFTLPDLDGRLHSLSDYRGVKVFLMMWGSY